MSNEVFDDSLYEEEDYNNINDSSDEEDKNEHILSDSLSGESSDEKIDIDKYKSDKNIGICLHSNSVEQNGVEICVDCGIELYKELTFDPEWRFYGENDNKHTSDPSRCHLRKSEDKSIYKDIEDYDFPSNISKEINEMYMKVTKGKIRRGNIRKKILFACAFNAYKNQNDPKNPEELREKFKLTKKDASTALTYYKLNNGGERKKPIYISPVSFIPNIMKKFNAKDTHIEKVEELYNKIYNKSKLLNRSNPQSVIAGLVYYYFRLIGGDITCQKFSSMVKLSDITIGRISKDISDILKTTDKVKLN